ncbi:hypothetical protein CHH28_17560 [Bacterioplanes sanyensis]|uniref:Outer membrane protein beta-barrel domain-containing protein n=1 Tax=Bacterioplanes sanyensis TaxID=1249553 RepID=A0A222FNT5_9GAMM|nr:hypothetical protein [Bacterioplanes sanyensis]ASP40372.1 hypothetical protein CHH28_17560 [Bacterioplanes sanyensis]
MTNPRKATKTVTLLLTALLASNAQAQSGLHWLSESSGKPDSGSGTGFGSNTISLTLPIERGERGAEQVTTAFHLDRTEFRWKGVNAADKEYYWLSVPIRYQQRRGSGTSFMVRFEPGVMTDLDGVDSDHLAANLELVGRTDHRLGFWQFGVVVDREFGNFSPRPVLGVALKTAGGTEMLLGFPQTRIQTPWGRDVSTYLHARPGGGVWREKHDALPKETFDVEYTNWRIGVGAEFRWRDNWWLNAELGTLRNRQIRATDSSGGTAVDVKATPGSHTYWMIGVNLRL